MAEYVNPGIVTVLAGQNIPMVSTAACGKPCIVHREGSGLVTLRGLTQQCKARFKVSFGANIAVPTGGFDKNPQGFLIHFFQKFDSFFQIFIFHYALDLRIGGFFCALRRQDGQFIPVQLRESDAEVLGNLLACPVMGD